MPKLWMLPILEHCVMMGDAALAGGKGLLGTLTWHHLIDWHGKYPNDVGHLSWRTAGQELLEEGCSSSGIPYQEIWSRVSPGQQQLCMQAQTPSAWLVRVDGRLICMQDRRQQAGGTGFCVVQAVWNEAQGSWQQQHEVGPGAEGLPLPPADLPDDWQEQATVTWAGREWLIHCRRGI